MVELIRDICKINAVSGNERGLRKYILENIRADKTEVDTMGNIIAFKKGSSDEDKICMIVTHIDECGMIVNDITDDGYIKFSCVGSVELRSIISKRVVIGDGIKGIIGMKAVHLQKAEERKTVKKAKELFIDIGAKDKKEAEKQVKKGDYICFDTDFAVIGDKIKGKAIERTGTAVMLNLTSVTPQYDTYFVFTVQKEVGMRGAMICASKINPDYAVVIDSIESADMFGANNDEIQARIGKGAVIQYSDKYSVSNRELVEKLVKTAEENNLQIQAAAAVKGMSDAGEIITSAGGVKTVTVGIPVRYTHTPVQMAAINDIETVSKLLYFTVTM